MVTPIVMVIPTSQSTSLGPIILVTAAKVGTAAETALLSVTVDREQAVVAKSDNQANDDLIIAIETVCKLEMRLESIQRRGIRQRRK